MAGFIDKAPRGAKRLPISSSDWGTTTAELELDESKGVAEQTGLETTTCSLEACWKNKGTC